MKIVLATHNEGKAVEMRRMLDVYGIELVTAGELGLLDVEETGLTFNENAALKACAAADISKLPAIADDSGMEILAMDGWPGIHSARCAGEGAIDEARQLLVLKRMEGIKDRRIRFISVMALAQPREVVPGTLNACAPTWFTGVCEGDMTLEPKGSYKPGLPYDPIFFSHELGKTFGEATEEEKASVSHRGRSGEQMRKYLEVLMKAPKRHS